MKVYLSLAVMGLWFANAGAMDASKYSEWKSKQSVISTTTTSMPVLGKSYDQVTDQFLDARCVKGEIVVEKTGTSHAGIRTTGTSAESLYEVFYPGLHRRDSLRLLGRENRANFIRAMSTGHSPSLSEVVFEGEGSVKEYLDFKEGGVETGGQNCGTSYVNSVSRGLRTMIGVRWDYPSRKAMGLLRKETADHALNGKALKQLVSLSHDAGQVRLTVAILQEGSPSMLGEIGIPGENGYAQASCSLEDAENCESLIRETIEKHVGASRRLAAERESESGTGPETKKLAVLDYALSDIPMPVVSLDTRLAEVRRKLGEFLMMHTERALIFTRVYSGQLSTITESQRDDLGRSVYRIPLSEIKAYVEGRPVNNRYPDALSPASQAIVAENAPVNSYLVNLQKGYELCFPEPSEFASHSQQAIADDCEFAVERLKPEIEPELVP